MIDMTVRPIATWPGGARTPAGKRKSPLTFRSTIGTTLAQLRSELKWINCTKAVIEAGFREQDISVRDGWPKANARTPDDPGVVLRVIDSKYGQLTYPCDTFSTWEANIRAIALTLEAQRKIDRYGVTRRGEQYAGWKALPSQGTNTLTAEAAAAIIVARSNGHLDSKQAKGLVASVLAEVQVAISRTRAARKATHPDAGGTTEAFQAVEGAASVLAQHFGVERL